MMTIVLPIYMIYMNSIFKEMDLVMIECDKENNT